MKTLGVTANQLAIELHKAKAKLKSVKEQIEWAKEEMKRPEYQGDEEALGFFKGIIFLEKYIEEEN